MKVPYPPLKAPTGFRIGGATTASCKSRLDDWKDREVMWAGEVIAREARGENRGSSLEAILLGRVGECTLVASLPDYKGT